MAIDVEHAIAQIRSLPVQDRLRVMEAVWDSLPEPSQSIGVSGEQAAELSRRLDALEADPDDVLTWDEVLGRLRGRL
jgi:putative addiction module component (TIGR02574 family)